MSDRLSEIEGRLAHEGEPCCDHSGRDEHGCWDCRNTGHAHPPYAEGEAKADLAALVKFTREIEAAEGRWRHRGSTDFQDDIRFRSKVLAARRALDAS